MERGAGRTVVVIGDGDLSEETVRALEASGAEVSHLREPDGEDVRQALEGDRVESIAVVGRKDAVVLRHALTVRSVSDEVPLLLTIFDPTMAEQMQERLGHTRVTSLADIVAPSLAGPCVDERFTAVGYGTVRETKHKGPHSLFFDGQRRYADQGFRSLTKSWLNRR